MARSRSTRKSSATEESDVPLLERDGMVSKDELAAYLGISLGTLDQWASRGGGPEYVIVGKHRKYMPADIKAWISDHKRVTASTKSDTGSFPAIDAA